MPKELSLNWVGDLSLTTLLANIAIGAILALIVRWHFKRFASTLSNRDELGQVLPFITLTTILIIAVVKSSLALSLGLVGALSIVRFRTPIKEPEELAYLFISIAIGLGLGAGQTATTTVVALVILLLTGLMKWRKRNSKPENLFLDMSWDESPEAGAATTIESVNGLLGNRAQRSDLRRLDVRDGRVDATYLVELQDANALTTLLNELRDKFPSMGVTFVDQKQLTGV